MSAPPHRAAYHSAWARPQGRTVAACARQADEERRQRAAARPTSPQRTEVSETTGRASAAQLIQQSQCSSSLVIRQQSASPLAHSSAVSVRSAPSLSCSLRTAIPAGALVVLRAAGVGR